MKLFVIKSTVFSMILGAVLIITYSIIRAWNGLQATDGDVLTAAKWNELVNSSSATPRGFIGAFNGTTCPTGWNPADGIDDPAVGGGTNPIDVRGQFLRGLNSFDNGITTRNDGKQDPDGAGRTSGNYQGDIFKAHNHVTMGDYLNLGGSYNGGGVAGGTVSNGSRRNTFDAGGTETRPKNVGVIFCIKE